MATASVGGPVREHPKATVAVLSLLGYGIVIGTFLGAVPAAAFPRLGITQVNLLADAIAVINTVTTCLLIAGWYWIRDGQTRKHAAAMVASFGLIMLFLALYLLKIGGGGTKEILVDGPVYYAYLAMLAIHILLSIVAVPVVLYALVLGLTRTPRELREETPHRRVGQVAAAAWILSLSLGVVTYVLLNHVYDWEFVRGTGAALLPVALARR